MLCLPLFTRPSAIFVVNQLLCCTSDLQLALRNLWMFIPITASSILNTFIISFMCDWSVSLFVWLVACLLACLVCLVDCLQFDCLFDCLQFACLFACLFVSWLVCLFVCLLACLFCMFVLLLFSLFQFLYRIKGSSDRYLALSRGRWQRAEPVALWSTQAFVAPHCDWFLVQRC